MDRWRGKVAVVTGASEGIGEAIARRLAGHGMKVAALARRQDLLEELERDVKDKGAGVVRGYACDVTSSNDVTTTFQKLQEDLGPISVLVNNAGLLRIINLTEIDMAATEALFHTNLLGLIKSSQEALRSMKSNGILDGHIINISSMAALMDMREWPEFGMYAATKVGVNKFSKSLKDQLAKEGSKTRVTVVCPGLVKTTMAKEIIKEHQDLPYMLPEDIADSVIYVLSAPSRVNVSEILMTPS